jgi:Winged helix DNA-binding domain
VTHLLRARLRNQQLVRSSMRNPAEIVKWLGAMQAQDYGGAKWAVALRAKDADAAAVEQAVADGTILRTHVLRPTWHFVARADIRWMLALTAPRVNASCASYHRNLGLDSATFARSRKVIERALGNGQHLTRSELAADLQHSGIHGDSIRLAFLMMNAELEGMICSGARRGNQITYALLDERAPRTAILDREEALAELARRYFTSHGPATRRDFAWWSGLTVRDAMLGIEAAGKALVREAIDGLTYWRASSADVPRASRCAHLLPNYDEYLVAYKDREPVIDRTNRRSAAVSNPFTHQIIVDGRLAGTWRPATRANSVMVDVAVHRPLSRTEKEALAGAVGRYSRFLGKPVAMRSA